MKNIPKFLMSFVASVSFLHAEVQPANIVLDDTTLIYNVPAGKTLIIENLIWSIESGYTRQIVSIKANGSNDFFYLRFDDTNPDTWAPVRPMRLTSGGELRILNSGGADWRNVLIMGLLVDNEDLYAANIDTKMENAREVGDTMVADLKYSSPRPRITTVQSADENFTFTKDATAKLEGTSSKSADLVSVDKNGGNAQFMRVAVNHRSSQE